MMRKTQFRFPIILAFLLSCLCIGETARAGVKVSANLTNNTIRVGETAQLYIEITTDGGESVKQPQFPNIEGLSFAFGKQTTSSTNVSIINGKMKSISTRGLIFLVQADKEGTYQIAPIRVPYDNTAVTANPVTLVVLSAPPTPQPKPGVQNQAVELKSTANNEGIILVPEISKNEVYVGEEIQLTFTAYFPLSVSRISIEDNRGQFQKFWKETYDLMDSSNQEERVIQGKRYLKVPVRRYFLYPLTAGDHTIEPLTLSCEVRTRGRFGFFQQGKTSEVSSVPIPVTVKPLPDEGKPKIFQGAVGQFDLKSTVEEAAVNEGSTVMFEITLSGYGNIRNAPRPVLPDLSKFDVFDSTKNESISVQADGVSGSVKFDYPLVPHGINANHIGPVKYAYFDPFQEQYITLSTDPIDLVIHPSSRGGSFPSTTGSNRGIITRLSEDFRFIAVTPAAISSVYLPIHRNPLYWLVYIIPILLIIGVWMYRCKQDYLARHPDVVRRSKAPKLAEKLLADARAGIENQDAKQTYSALAKAMTDYISNRWNIAAAGLTSEELQTRLQNLNIPEDTSSSVMRLLQTCDAVRFSGSGINQQQMRKDYEQAQRIFSEFVKRKE